MTIDELRNILHKASSERTESLSLHGLGLTNKLFHDCAADLATLAPHLKNLDLHNTPVIDLTPLVGLAHLHSLNLNGCEWILDSGLAHLSGLTSLHSLDLSWCNKITDSGLAHLSGLTSLHSLDLMMCCRISEAGLALVSRLTALQSLNLGWVPLVTDSGMARLSALTALQSLNLNRCERITDAGLTHLGRLTALHSLDLNGCEKITDAGLAHLGRLTALNSLDLKGCQQVTDAGIIHLSDLMALQSLDLSWCRQITDAGLVHLGRLTALRSLDLNGSQQITDAGLTHLGGLTGLQSLNLDGCQQITNAGLAYLIRLPNLEKLSLYGSRVKGVAEALVKSNDAQVILEAWRRGVELDEARIALVGMGDVGKTWLFRRCFMNKVINPATERKPTHDIDLVRPEAVKWKPRVSFRTGKGERIIVPQVWDFGGQLVKHGVHEPFLSADGRTVYVVVLSAQRVPQRTLDNNGCEAGNGLAYWLKTLAHFAGPEAPVLIAVTQCDKYHSRKHRPIDELTLDGKTSVIEQKADDLSESTGACVVAPVIDGCSACLVDESSIQPLRQGIEHALARLSSLDGKVTQGLANLKKQVERELAGRALVEIEQFYHWCAECDVNDADRQDTYLRVLHHLGSLFYFGLTRKEQRERDQVLTAHSPGIRLKQHPPGQHRFWQAKRDPMLRQHIVNPHWLKWPVYEVVEQSEKAAWQTSSEIEEIIHKAQNRLAKEPKAGHFRAHRNGPAVVLAVLELTGLCYYDEDKGQYLFPRGLPESGLGLTNTWKISSACWDYLPEAAFHRLLVRMHVRRKVARDESGVALHRRRAVMACNIQDNPKVRVAIFATPETGLLEFRFDPQAEQDACVKLAEEMYDLFRGEFMGGREAKDKPVWPEEDITNDPKEERGNHLIQVPQSSTRSPKRRVGRPLVMTPELLEIFSEINADWQNAQTSLKTNLLPRVPLKAFWTPDRRRRYQDRFEKILNGCGMDLNNSVCDANWLSDKMKHAKKKGSGTANRRGKNTHETR